MDPVKKVKSKQAAKPGQPGKAPPVSPPEGMKREVDPLIFPDFLIVVEVDQKLLKERLKCVDPCGHNTEKDFQRRYQAYLQCRKEDETDLAAKVQFYASQFKINKRKLHNVIRLSDVTRRISSC